MTDPLDFPGDRPEDGGVFIRVSKARRRDRPGRPWVLRWYEPPGSRRRRQQTLGAMSAALAEAYRLAWQNRLNAVVDPATGPPRWAEVRGEYLRAKAAQLARASVAGARYALDHLERVLAPRVLADVDRRALERFRTQRIEATSIETARKEVRTLRAFFAWALDLGYAETNPAEGLKWTGRRRVPPEALSEAETGRLLAVAAAEPAWLAASIRLAACWGLRAGELASLEPADCDLAAGVVRIRAKRDWTPKSGRGRVVGLDPETHGHLADLRHVAGPVLWGDAPSASAYLGRLRKAVRRLCASAATVPLKKPIHGLRSTAITNFQRRGIPSHVLREVVGHTRDATTRNHYDGRTPDEIAHQAERFMREEG